MKMTKNKIKSLPSDMDHECIAICEAMNRMPGIMTTESCSGHGKESYNIFFAAESLKVLPDLLYWFDGCHCGHYGWRVVVRTDCAKSPVYFTLEGPIGKEAYQQAEEIAVLITKDARQLKEA